MNAMSNTSDSAVFPAGDLNDDESTGINPRRNSLPPTHVFAGTLIGYARVSRAPQRISQSILTLRMLCEMRCLLGARSVERSGPAGIDDHAAADAGATVVGLEAVSDVPHVGVLVVLAVGV